MKGAMCFFRRRSKKSTSNPYADRGLDKFAMVSAELEAKREKLAAELDTPLSMVKFAIGSHNRWIPIVLSKSTRKARETSKKKHTEKDTPRSSIKGYESHANGLITEEKGISSMSGVVDNGKLHSQWLVAHGDMPLCDSNADDSLEDKVLCSGLQTTEGNTPLDVSIAKKSPLGRLSNQNGAYFGGLINVGRALSSCQMKENVTQESSKDDDKAHLDGGLTSKSKPSLDRLMGDGRARSHEIAEVTSATSEVEARAALDPLQVHNLKRVVPDISELPRRANPASNISNPAWLETAPCSLAGECSKRHSSPAPRGAWLKGGTCGIMMEEMRRVQGTASKQPIKSNVAENLNVFSAPSTPRDTRQPKGPLMQVGSLSKAPSFPELGACTDLKVEKLVEKASINTVKRSRLSVSAAVSGEQLRSRQLGEALVAVGLLLGLTGLVMGYVSALIGVVCWWYLLPILRKAVGDNPIVRRRSNSMVVAKSKSTNFKAQKNKVMVEAGCDLQFYEYPKKVIMEGMLDRSRGSRRSHV